MGEWREREGVARLNEILNDEGQNESERYHKQETTTMEDERRGVKR